MGVHCHEWVSTILVLTLLLLSGDIRDQFPGGVSSEFCLRTCLGSGEILSYVSLLLQWTFRHLLLQWTFRHLLLQWTFRHLLLQWTFRHLLLQWTFRHFVTQANERLLYTFADVDECRSQPCPMEEACSDRTNGYTCGSGYSNKHFNRSREDKQTHDRKLQPLKDGSHERRVPQ